MSPGRAPPLIGFVLMQRQGERGARELHTYDGAETAGSRVGEHQSDGQRDGQNVRKTL